jgi:DNA-binding beta-propeller fold protein YncE
VSPARLPLVVAVLLAAAGAPALSPLPLPGGEGGIGFDDLRFSAELNRILVPAGRTGRLDLVDPSSRSVEVVEGFSRSASQDRGHGEGTTSADAGAGFVFAIDRTNRTLVAVDPRARIIVTRTKLEGAPDYVRWVEPTHEVWVTEPAREAIETFRFQGGATPTLTRTGKIPVPAGPESLVVDAAHGRAYTNTFKDATVSIDVPGHAVIASWPNGCRGARGLALDAGRGWVLVGCDEGKAVALDASHGGRTVGTAKTGGGVDSIAYSPQLSHLYVPAADAATLTVLGVGERGQIETLGTLPTAPDAHCAAADAQSGVYVCDPRNGRLLVLRDPYPPSH